MSKLVIETNQEEFSKLIDIIPACFRNTFQSSGEFGSIATFGKLKVPTTNVHSGNSGFAVGIGTYIYEGKIDSDALRCIYEAFSGDVRALQKVLIGSYAIAIWKNNKLVVFVDSNGTQDLYYTLDKYNVSICSSLFHLGKVHRPISLNSEAMVQQLFQSCIVGDATILDGISRLDGNHAISWHEGIWSMDFLPPLDMSIEKGRSLSSAAACKFSSIRDTFVTPAVAMTGGQDSRLALSLLLGAGIRPRLIYWRGNSISTNTKEQDYECTCQLASKYDLDVEVWDACDSSREHYAKALGVFGEYAHLYGYNENLIHSFFNTSVDFITFGYFGEMFRNTEDIQAYDKESFTVAELFDDLYLRGSYKDIYPEFTAYRAHILDSMTAICENLGIDSSNLTKSDFQHLNTEMYRKRADIHMTNYANQFMYSFLVLGDRMMTDSMNLMGFDDRVGSKPMIEAIHNLTPELLEVPFFSHIRKMKYDAQSHALNEESQVKTRIKQYLQKEKKSAWYYPFARRIYHLLNHDKKSLTELNRDSPAREKYLALLESADVLQPIDRKRLNQLELDSNILLNYHHFEIMWQEMNRG